MHALATGRGQSCGVLVVLERLLGRMPPAGACATSTVKTLGQGAALFPAVATGASIAATPGALAQVCPAGGSRDGDRGAYRQ
ncbi:MAG: hypothetical protein ACE5I7_07695 [Candidatus Binatia bacterium]